MPDQKPMMSPEKADFLARSKKFWNPGKTQSWIDFGVDLVIDRREEYFLYDMDGHRLIDAHLNGGTFNLGHRNPELIATLTEAMNHFDMGNHHFPSLVRTELAEELARTAPGDLQYTIYGSVAVRRSILHSRPRAMPLRSAKLFQSSKRTTATRDWPSKRGDDRFSKLFLSDGPADRRICSRTIQRSRCHGSGFDREGRRLRDYGNDSRHLRVPDARRRLSPGGQTIV